MAREVPDGRWVREVEAPDGRRYEVVAVRRHDALHDPDTSQPPGSELAGAAAEALVGSVRAWRRRRNPGWTVAVLTARRLGTQKVVFREDLPIEADPVSRAEQVAAEVADGGRRL